MPDGRDNKPRYKTNPAGGGNSRGGYKPRGSDHGGFKPRGSDHGGFKPRGDDHGGFKPRGDDRGGFKPRGDDHGGFKPRGDDHGAFKPRGDDRGGFKPRGNHSGPNPRGNAFSRYSDRNSVRVIDRSGPNQDRPPKANRFGESSGKPDHPDRFDKPARFDKPVRFDKPARFDRTARPAKPMYGKRPATARPPEARQPEARPIGALPPEPRPVMPRPPREPHRPEAIAPAAIIVTESTPNSENILAGRNPIREALRAGRDLEKLMTAKGDLSGSAREIVAMARERGVPIHEVDRAALERLSPAHQGLVAIASAYKYSTVEGILARAAERGEEPLVVVLDGITDPHNLGAIIRSAECAGAHGVVVPDRRAAGLTAAVVKASAGAIEHLPVARVVNITRLLAELKEQGLWILAAHTSGEDYTRADLSGPIALVIGSEGEGISRLALEKSDKRVTLPVRGRTDSLNASVAAGILLYEVARRRGI
ncbi:MAG: 23S rRNA (guanosine(2251)-2'-O)-methyltransferase RlmB [Oscillospiraceae bacterium]|jgi:23S rRNA (guanosine2251-2'-O)-methyltransferase|nr:23S rRNA (guanosine(2251)-2'-O)-methyltransferase RlmB [Oscillospiraceae bacterium]